MKELQTMFWEMAKGFEFPDWSNFPQPVYDSPQWSCTSEEEGNAVLDCSCKQSPLSWQQTCNFPLINSNFVPNVLDVVTGNPSGSQFCTDLAPIGGTESAYHLLDKSYSMKELQTMFWEMAKGFEFPDWSNFPQPVYDSPQWSCTSVRLDDPRT
ncbi:unnamed protein product [Ilex paraguariensis]|uniref:Uncharacterized protein n=1 Tax=Ilex paraguariensis TaxID=185542 RepID=A0ABC8SC42_9AQUA